VSFERITRQLPERIRSRRRFFRFLLVGGINTAFGYAAFVACLWLGMHYAIAAAAATILGVLFNFHSTGKLVFSSTNYRHLPLFLGVYVVVYLVNVLGLSLLSMAKIPPWLGGLLLILPCAMLSYFLNSRFVFRT